jgi:membrane protein
VNTIRSLFDFVVDVVRRFGHDAGSFLAAMISYYALFSIFPLLLLAISAAGFALAYTDGTEDVLNYAAAVIPQFSEIVRTNVEAIARDRTSIGVIGLLALLWAGTYVSEAIEYALNQVWKVPVGRHFILSKIFSIAGVIAIIIVLLATSLLSAGYQAFQAYWLSVFEATPPLAALRAASVLLGMGVTFGALLIIYKVVPNLKLGFRDVWVGAVFSTVAWELAKRLFVVYTSRAARFEAVYGSVGVIIGLLVWLYISAIILIFGAEINAALKARRKSHIKAVG